jgi:hypothetical protein
MSPVSWQTKKTVSFFFLLLAMLDHYLKENAIPIVRIQLPQVAARLREPQSIGNSRLHRLDQTSRFLLESPREGGISMFGFLRSKDGLPCRFRLLACHWWLITAAPAFERWVSPIEKVGGTDCGICPMGVDSVGGFRMPAAVPDRSKEVVITPHPLDLVIPPHC